MKNYLYQGNQASLSMRSGSKSLLLKKGVMVAVALALHAAIEDHPVVKSLVKSGELDISDAEAKQADSKPADSQDYGKLTVPQLKEALTAANIYFDDGAKKADLIALLEQDDHAKQAADQNGAQGT